VQDETYARMRERLIADGKALAYSGPATSSPRAVDKAKLPGGVVDDRAAKLTGNWRASTAGAAFVGESYQHEGSARDGRATARFEGQLPRAGRYEVRLAYAANANRSSKTTVEIHHAGGHHEVVVNQQQTPPIDGLFVSLGTFDFAPDRPAAVVVTNRGADGYVIIDAVQWLPK